MDTLLQKERIHIEAIEDRVMINIANIQVNIPYASSFQIAQGLRLAAKTAMRYAKENSINWTSYAQLSDFPHQTIPYQVLEQKQIKVQKNYDWAVGYDGEDVKIKFGNVEFKFHFVIALKMSEWIRDAGHKSKAWSGDSSKSMIAFGILNNAEDHYKHGIT